MAKELQQLLRKLPAVDQLLNHAGAQQLIEQYPRKLVVECLRKAVEGQRQEILRQQEMEEVAALPEYLIQAAEQLL
ncbi:MAG TPA: hypothetical protein VHS59_07050, partial [Bacillota bacterium]|nr:hypothetical protein [Bacillota bacterium]